MNTKYPAMPKLIGKLLLWFVIIYFVIIKVREIVFQGTPVVLWEGYTDAHSIALLVSSFVAFFSYALFCYLALHRNYLKRPWWQVMALLVAIIIGCMLFRSFMEEFLIYHIFGEGNYNPNMGWPVYLVDNLYYAIAFSSLGIIFYFAQFGQFSEQARRQSELLHRETELKFLRSQVNPHFLFNTLNNVYSLVATNSDSALPVIDKLSGLLRYALYDQEKMVPLERELDYLRDLLELEALRVDGLVPPEVKFGPFTAEWQLPPLLLVPFIENAFKHGELRNQEHPLKIHLEEVSGKLHFRVSNLIRKGILSKDEVGGIGLNNVRKRLELMYPGRHELTVNAGEEKFVVDLKFG